MRGNYVGVSRFVKKSVVVTGTLCIAFFVCSADASSQQVATQGNPIPEFKLSDLDGKSFKSSQLRGRVVLLDLWATWCEPCLEDIPMLNRLYANFGNRGLQVIGIAVQSGRTNDIRQHVEKLGIKYPVLVGNERIMELYVPVGFPVRYLISRDGRIAAKYLGSLPDQEKKRQTDLERDIESLLQHERLRMQAR